MIVDAGRWRNLRHPGAQAGEARLRKVASEGGLSRFRRAAETPFNLILEARI